MSSFNAFTNQLKAQLEEQFGHMLPKWYELINWTEPLIIGLISFHLILLIIVLWTRRMFRTQCFLFCLISGMVGISEQLNSIARINWKSFATQQYFDKSGVFMGIFYSGPLLCIGFIQLISCLIQTANLLVLVKRKELLAKKKKDN